DNLRWHCSLAMKDSETMWAGEAIIAASDIIRDASIGYSFDMRSCSLVAENICQKWNRIGKTTIPVNGAHILLQALGSSEKDAVFIGISNSGETHEVIKLEEMARSLGHKTISITRFGNNTLSKNSDVALQHVRSNEIEVRSAATSSLHAQFLVVDVLFYVYDYRNYD